MSIPHLLYENALLYHVVSHSLGPQVMTHGEPDSTQVSARGSVKVSSCGMQRKHLNLSIESMGVEN